jgi:hypothetical protein
MKTIFTIRVGPAPKTPWERFKEWFWRMVDDLFDSNGGKIGLGILQYLLIDSCNCFNHLTYSSKMIFAPYSMAKVQALQLISKNLKKTSIHHQFSRINC